jgi:predicted nicotinamide N-methyase
MKVNISDIGVFPHGLGGLKLWDTNIVLARYAILRNEIFINKTVLELNAGVGIGGIAIRKWTKAKYIGMCDTR